MFIDSAFSSHEQKFWLVLIHQECIAKGGLNVNPQSLALTTDTGEVCGCGKDGGILCCESWSGVCRQRSEAGSLPLLSRKLGSPWTPYFGSLLKSHLTPGWPSFRGRPVCNTGRNIPSPLLIRACQWEVPCGTQKERGQFCYLPGELQDQSSHSSPLSPSCPSKNSWFLINILKYFFLCVCVARLWGGYVAMPHHTLRSQGATCKVQVSVTM